MQYVAEAEKISPVHHCRSRDDGLYVADDVRLHDDAEVGERPGRVSEHQEEEEDVDSEDNGEEERPENENDVIDGNDGHQNTLIKLLVFSKSWNFVTILSRKRRENNKWSR